MLLENINHITQILLEHRYLLAHLYMKQDNTSEAARCFRACVHGRMYRPEDSENAEVIAMAKCGQIREAIERSREIVRCVR